MSETISEYVTFKICGDYMTNITRDICAEGRWRNALETLMEGLHGITMEQCIQILKGEKKLIGDSSIGMDLVDQEPCEELDEYLKQLNFMYSGYFRPNGSSIVYTPYAYVTSYGPDDMGGHRSLRGIEDEPQPRPDRNNDGFVGDSAGMPPAWRSGDMGYKRTMAYADNPWEDRAYMLEFDKDEYRSKTAIIFKRAEFDPPLWMKPSNKPQDALDDFVAVGKHLSERGACFDMPERPSIPDPLDNIVVDDEEEEVVGARSDLIKSLMPPGLEHVADDVAGAMSGDLDWDSKPEVSELKDYTSGYIMRDGTFYGCGYMAHAALGTRIMKNVFGVEDGDPEQELDNRGIVRIQQSAFDQDVVCVMCEKKPTKKQINAVFDFSVEHKGILENYDLFMDRGGMCRITLTG